MRLYTHDSLSLPRKNEKESTFNTVVIHPLERLEPESLRISLQNPEILKRSLSFVFVVLIFLRNASSSISINLQTCFTR